MLEIQTIIGPHGIPILYQRMPEMVKSVSLSWTIFTGSADDESVGKPGLYHWFEHVPFRGTVKYPGGYNATRGWATKFGGYVNAYTDQQKTTYLCSVPLIAWKQGLSVITDLFAQPIIRDLDIKAERDIIRQEIARAHGTLLGSANRKLLDKIYENHPFGHQVLGTEESLDSMDSSLLRLAHKKGYDRSRALLIIIGNIPFEEVLKELSELAEIIPDNSLTERRKPSLYTELPIWNGGKTHIIDTKFSSSVVYMLFPIDKKDPKSDYFKISVLDDLFQFGDLSSPLYRVLREERNLVYSTFCFGWGIPAMDCFGFCAETKNQNIEPVIQAFRDVLKNSAVTSKERLTEVQQGVGHVFDMRPIDPDEFRATALKRYSSANCVINDSDRMEALNQMSTEKVVSFVEGLSTDKAQMFIFKGTN